MDARPFIDSVKIGDGYPRPDWAAIDKLVAAVAAKDAQALSRFAERALTGILKRLDGMVSDNYMGKHVVLVFATRDQYYDYISHFYPDKGGESAAHEAFGRSLGGLIEQFFGEGDWSPKAQTA